MPFTHFMTTTDFHFPQIPQGAGTLLTFNSLQEIASDSQTIKKLQSR